MKQLFIFPLWLLLLLAASPSVSDWSTAPGFGEIELEEDILLRIADATASDFEPYYEAPNSIKGQTHGDHEKAPYHSSVQETKFPVVLEYILEKPEDIDYLIYYSRSGSGNFGKFDLAVQKSMETGYREVGSYDFKMEGGSHKLDFPETLTHISKVRFTVHSGLGGFVSCEQMAFYRKNADKKLESALLAVFTDLTCTAVRKDATREKIASLSPYFRWLAKRIQADNFDPWKKMFRVRDYRPYSDVGEWAEKLMTGKYSMLDNPTGIYASKGDTILVLVGETGGRPIKLTAVGEDSPWNFKKTQAIGTFYHLQEGVNRIIMQDDGDLFLVYTGNPQDPAVRVHIPPGCGTVNGFFDLEEHRTDKKYAELLNKASCKYFQVKGERIMFYFHREKLLEYVPDGILSAINLWDNYVGWQHELMGIDDVRPAQMNNRMMAISPEGSYMWASDYQLGFVYTYLNNILLYDHVMAEKDNAWGPAHEIGHIHQHAINWAGCYESSNNLFSNYTLYKLGRFTSRGTELSLPDPVASAESMTLAHVRFVDNRPWWDIGDGHQGENTETHMRMYWQLFTYYHRCGHKPDFWPTLFGLMRDHRDELSTPMDPGEKQMQFARMASHAADEDLTDFFEIWGFLMPVDTVVNQSGEWKYKVTPQMIEDTKRYMAQYPKARPFYYIEDRKKEDEGLQNMPPDVGYYTQFEGEGTAITKPVTYTLNDRTIQIKDGEEAVAFEIRRDGKLIYFSNFFEFTVPESISLKNMTIEAVQADGKRVLITPYRQ